MPLKSLPDLNLHTQLEALTSKLEAMQAEMDSLQSQCTLASPAPTVISLDQLSQLSALLKEPQVSTPETFSGKEVLSPSEFSIPLSLRPMLSVPSLDKAFVSIPSPTQVFLSAPTPTHSKVLVPEILHLFVPSKMLLDSASNAHYIVPYWFTPHYGLNICCCL